MPPIIDDDPRFDRPQTSTVNENITEIRYLVRFDRRLTTREMANELKLDLSFYAVLSSVTENFNMRRMSAKFIPKLLLVEQKKHILQVSQELFNLAENDPDFSICFLS